MTGAAVKQAARSDVDASQRLVTLAILKANWNAGRSYLDNFIPFVGECLRTAAGPVGVVEVQDALRTSYGMEIPHGAVGTILGRVVQRGWAHRRDRMYEPDREALADVRLPGKQQELLRCHQALVHQLCEFASDRYAQQLTEQEAASALDAYVEVHGAPIVLRGATPEIAIDLRDAGLTAPNSEYIVQAFVEYLAEADPDSFGYLETVVEGAMLASVVYLPDLGSVERRFRDSTVYLDTPFLLRALGHLGPELQAPACELLDLLRGHGARTACFDHTVLEVRGVLLAAAQAVGARRRRGPGDVVSHFRQLGLRRSDVELRAADIEGGLKRLTISVLPRPTVDRSSSVDEAEVEEILHRRVRYFRDDTLRHDLDALMAIDRLRAGRTQPILEDSKALFVTTNKSLVKVAREAFGRGGAGFTWPPAMLDADLATLVWLKQPMKAPDLPRKQIMADCYAALRPDPVVWNRWLDEIERTEAAGSYTDEQLDVMRYSPDAQRALMDRTFGNAGAIEGATIREVLDIAEAAIVGPTRVELSAARRDLVRERSAREAAESRESDERVAREQAEGTLQQDRETRRKRLEQRASRHARLAGRIVFVLLLGLAAASLVLSAFGDVLPGPGWPWPIRVIALAIAIFSALVAWGGAGWGWDFKHFVTRFEAWLQPRLLQRALRRLGEL